MQIPSYLIEQLMVESKAFRSYAANLLSAPLAKLPYNPEAEWNKLLPELKETIRNGNFIPAIKTLRTETKKRELKRYLCDTYGVPYSQNTDDLGLAAAKAILDRYR